MKKVCSRDDPDQEVDYEGKTATEKKPAQNGPITMEQSQRQ